MRKKKFVKRVLRLLMVSTLLAALLLPQGSAKYLYSDPTPTKVVTVTWLGMNSLPQASTDKAHNANAIPDSTTYLVTDGVNDGWYAIIAWGAIGGWGGGGSNPGGWGNGGCVRCIVWLDGGTYTIVAGSAGEAYNASPATNKSYGGGTGYTSTYIGGGGGGLSGVFKNGVSKASAIAVAGGGGGGAGGNAGSSNKGDYGGNAAGGSTGGIGLGLVSTLWPGTDNATLKIAPGEAPGGSSREDTNTGLDAGSGAYERGAGGGRYNDHSGTSGRPGGDNVNVLNGGGHSIWPHFNDPTKPTPCYTQPGSTTNMTGGNAGAQNNGVGGGGGGAGYQGGGAGGNSSNSTGNGTVSMGGGGGGSSYIIPSVTPSNPDYATAKASRSYQTGNTNAAGGFSSLNPTILTFLNGLAVPRPVAHSSGFGGVVVMAYLGPSDEIFNAGGGITFN